ncbi:nucleolar DEAD-box protein required for synthesis of 60S ribosomal subunit, partial [Ceratobasidium sp. 394]
MARSDYVMTIDSDDDEPIQRDEDGPTLDNSFSFDVTGGALTGVLDAWDASDDVVKSGSKPEPISVDDIIERRRLKAQTVGSKRKREEDVEDSSESGSESSEESAFGGAANEEQQDDNSDPLASDNESDNEDAASEHSDSEDNSQSPASESDADSDIETTAQKAQKAAYFAPESTDSSLPTHTSFTTMNLSRPLLRALTSAGFHAPTPIQAATIPVALLGKDIVGGAVTGSGKTAAFMIPILERLLYRSRDAQTRVVVLVPTRELAV